MKPDVARIVISSYQLSSQLFDALMINLGSNQTITLNFYDPNNILINSTDLPVDFQTIQMPGYMTYTKFVDDPTTPPMLQIFENTAVGSDGNMNLLLFFNT